jgi:hypothetical protein
VIINIKGFAIEQVRGPLPGDPPRWNITLPDDPAGFIVSCHSMDAAVQWCHNPALYPTADPFWFETRNERGEKLLMRSTRATEVAKAILAQDKK